MALPLALLFQESVNEVLQREQTALEALLEARQRKVVLFGAGTLGKNALPLLSEIGAKTLAFADNNPAIWGIVSRTFRSCLPNRRQLCTGAQRFSL